MSFVEFIPKGDSVINYGVGEVTVRDGIPYVVHNSWIGQVPGSIRLMDQNFRQYDLSKSAEGKSILFMRTMGGGDMLFLSPLIKLLREKYNVEKITFSCVQEQAEMANMLDGVDEVLPLPIPSEEFNKFDFHFEVAGLLEHNQNNENRNAYDVYLEHLGCEVTDGIANVDEIYKRPYIKENIYKDVIKHKNLIGIHPFANDPIRQCNVYLIPLLIKRLKELGYEPVVFASKAEREAYLPIFDPTTQWADGTSFVKTAELAASCQSIIGCDSLLIHLAQAVGVHTVALYGPFNPETRIKYYKNLELLDTAPDCRCQQHGIGRCPKGPQISPCMNIDIDYIIGALKQNVEIEYTGPINTSVTAFNMIRLKGETDGSK